MLFSDYGLARLTADAANQPVYFAPDPVPAPAPVVAPAVFIHTAVDPANQPVVVNEAPVLTEVPPAPVVTTPSGAVVSSTPIETNAPVLVATGTGVGVQQVVPSGPDPEYLAMLASLKARADQIAASQQYAPRSSAMSVDRVSVPLIPAAPAAVGQPSSLGTVAVVLAAVGALYLFTRRR